MWFGGDGEDGGEYGCEVGVEGELWFGEGVGEDDEGELVGGGGDEV